MKPKPYDFDEFFLTGLEPSISPFLTENSKKWCRNLGLKNTIFAAFLLILSLIFFSYNPYVSYFLLSIIYFSVGIPAFLSTVENFKKLDININVLMTLAAFVAAAIGRPQEGALLLVLFGVSGSMEKELNFKTKCAIHDLNKISPTKAYLIQADGLAHEKSIKEINVNDHILIKAGEVVPLDGIITEGSSSLNLEHLTGERIAQYVKKDDFVHAGSRNNEGAFTLRVLKTSHESTLNQIIELISKATKTKPKIERLFDSFGRIYASSVIFLAFFFAFIMPFIFSIPFFGMEGAIYRSLAFLITASPCALIIAIPSAYLSALSACAKKGIILKGGSVFDALYNCRLFAFDKTGTLTEANLVLKEIVPINAQMENSKALFIAASLEMGSTHPIAKAIIEASKKNPLPQVTDFKSIPGYGVEAMVKIDEKFHKAFLGNVDRVIEGLGPKEKSLLLEEKNKALKKGEIITVLHVKNEIFLFAFFDSIRKKVKPTILRMKNEFGIKSIMLTGDNSSAAKAIATQVDIEEVYAELKPEDKLNLVKNFAKKGDLVMVGDGINDAPSLAQANVGISMGKGGSATAIDASDIVLLTDNIELFPWLLLKTKTLRKVVTQNLVLALSVIGFTSFPALLGYIPLWVAVLLHEGGTFLVALNSLRLLKK
jgi:Zn2+/Cd2+-exporting ATPase